MFTKPECQVGLLEYAGFLKAKSVKNKIPVTLIMTEDFLLSAYLCTID